MSQPYPTSLSQITLQQRIDYDNLYGKALKARQIEIDKMPDSPDKIVEEFDLLADTACKSYSFFTGINLETIRSGYEIRQVINVYTATLSVLLDEEQDIEILPEYQFEGDTWVIAEPGDEKGTDSMNWPQLQQVKKMLLDLMALSEGDWSVVPNLCALYLRKEDETLEDAIASYESRRLLFLTLTLDIAMAVAKYLQETIQLFILSIEQYQPTT